MKAIHLKPQLAGGKIFSTKVGRKWTYFTMRLSTRTIKRAIAMAGN